jgi:organic hydroperoxide reductase OsmC/OhrA
MSELSIDLHWRRAEPELRPGKFSNAHTVRFNDSHELQADAAPDWGGNPANTNPEQALAAALSSCHMMMFLALAAKAGWPVASFDDQTVAHLGKNPKGQMSVTRIDSSSSCLPISQEAIFSNLRWTEKCQAGHYDSPITNHRAQR